MLSTYSARDFGFSGGQLAVIALSNFCQHKNSQGELEESTLKDASYRIDQLDKLIGYVHGESGVDDLRGRVQLVNEAIHLMGLDKAKEVATETFKEWTFSVEWSKYKPAFMEHAYCRCSLCGLERRIDQERAEGKFQAFTIQALCDSIAEAALAGRDPVFNPLHATDSDLKWATETLAEELGPNRKEIGFKILRKAFEKASGKEVKVDYHPEWLRQRAGSDWTRSNSWTVATCLQVFIGDDTPLTVTLWPNPPFVVAGGYYTAASHDIAYYEADGFEYADGELSGLYLNTQRDDGLNELKEKRGIKAYSLDTIRGVLTLATEGNAREDFDRRMELLRASDAVDGCILQRTLRIFEGWAFSIDWKTQYPFGRRASFGNDSLSYLDFKVRSASAERPTEPFTVAAYAKTVAEALVQRGQPSIPEDRAPRDEIRLAAWELYLQIGPDPFPGIALLNEQLRAVGGDGYRLELNAEWVDIRINGRFNKEKPWKPLTYWADPATLDFFTPDGSQECVVLEAGEPLVRWGAEYRHPTSENLYLSALIPLDDGRWLVNLINYSPPTWRDDEAVHFIRDHGYAQQADNLQWIIDETKILHAAHLALPDEQRNYKAYDEIEWKLHLPWRLHFPIPDVGVSGLHEYVEFWRSQKSAEAHGKQWVRVDQPFWLQRVVSSAAAGNPPKFEEWEYVGPNDYAEQLWKEVLARESSLSYLEGQLQQYNPEVTLESVEEACESGCPCGHGWELQLTLCDTQKQMYFIPHGKAFRFPETQ